MNRSSRSENCLEAAMSEPLLEEETYKCVGCGADISKTVPKDANTLLARLAAAEKVVVELKDTGERVLGKFDDCRAALARQYERVTGKNPCDLEGEHDWHTQLIEALDNTPKGEEA